MTKTWIGELLKWGANQMLRLSAKFQFESKEVHITRDDATGYGVLSSRRGPES